VPSERPSVASLPQNHILAASHGKQIAVIENEFGDVGIDDKLLSHNSKFSVDEELVETLNGCVCCSVRSDLVRVLQRLGERRAAGELSLDAVVIETTGMADPAPVAKTLLTDGAVRAFARLDGIVTLVDAKHIEQHLDEEKPEGVVNEAVAQVPTLTLTLT
jgi:G3E family GTPase